MKSIVMQAVATGGMLSLAMSVSGESVGVDDPVRLDFAEAQSEALFAFEDVAPPSQDDTETQLAMLQDTVDEYGPYSGAWEFTLSGTGTSDEDFDANSFGVTFSIGYFFTEAIEVALRQSFFVASNGDTVFSGTTRVASDFHFDLDTWRPFIGGSFGATYGDNVDDTWLAGLEGGLKWYVKPETFIFGMVEWLWFFDDASDIGDAFDDGQWVYTLGIGFTF